VLERQGYKVEVSEQGRTAVLINGRVFFPRGRGAAQRINACFTLGIACFGQMIDFHSGSVKEPS
jgi:hypothetical protein